MSDIKANLSNIHQSYATLSTHLKENAPKETIQSDAQNFSTSLKQLASNPDIPANLKDSAINMAQLLEQYQGEISKLQQAIPQGDDAGVSFNLPDSLSGLSQYIENVSNQLQAEHGDMSPMNQGTKGQ